MYIYRQIYGEENHQEMISLKCLRKKQRQEKRKEKLQKWKSKQSEGVCTKFNSAKKSYIKKTNTGVFSKKSNRRKRKSSSKIDMVQSDVKLKLKRN